MVKGSEQRSEVGQGATVRGRIEGREDLAVFGRVEGDVVLEGTLFVAPGGVVRGDVRAAQVLIAGLLLGDVSAAERIQIASTGRVRGDIEAPALQLEAGGAFSGALRIGAERTQEQRARAAVEPASSSPSVAAPSTPPVAAPTVEERRRRILVKKRG
jgi:cytoskeletal protein CcmA (bactofilin family)